MEEENRWFYSYDSGLGRDQSTFKGAGNAFVVAKGRREWKARERAEISVSKTGWGYLGDRDGNVTLADCMAVILGVAMNSGVSQTRMISEMARVPVFALFIVESGINICNFVSNPMNDMPRDVEPFSERQVRLLQDRIDNTLGIAHDWD